MEDFITWVDSSKIKQHVMNYNEEVCGRILGASSCGVYTLLYKSLGSIFLFIYFYVFEVSHQANILFA